MGPTTLFDKSFLQSLSLDESVWFDKFFYPIVCPVFYMEVLSDLKKAGLRRDPEEEVRIIADKFPEMYGTPIPNYQGMVVGELLGNHPVPLTGQIPIVDGRLVRSGHRKGVVFDFSPEAEAFRRWQSREFYALEHHFASAWRTDLEALDLNRGAEVFRVLGISRRNCQLLLDAMAIADDFVNQIGRSFKRMELALMFLGVPEEWHRLIWRRWSIRNDPPLSSFSPYAAHVLKVEIFFQTSLAANLISPDRLSNRVDIAYLYYLPFCMVFVSWDKLHRRCAPLFLRNDQSFIWGPDMKCALSKLDEHYSLLPEKEKKEGLMRFAPYPPTEFELVVSEAWDRHLPNWREHAKNSRVEPGSNTEVVKELTNLAKSPSLRPDKVDFDSEDADMMCISRRVRKRKGKWWQLPKSLENNANEEN